MESRFVPVPNAVVPHPAQVAFEARRVMQVLKVFGLVKHESDLRDAFHKKWNTPQCFARRLLTFEAFHEFFPTFPVVLEAHSFYRTNTDQRFGLAQLMRGFDKSIIFARYMDVFARGQVEARGRPIGMIFSYGGCRSGVVIHSAQLDTRGLKFIYPVPADRAPHVLTIEPFVGLLKFLALSGWRPDDDDPAVHAVTRQPPQRTDGFVVQPWMLRLNIRGQGWLLLALLLALWNSSSGWDRLFFRLMDQTLYLVADHRELAAMTGLSARQIERALEDLRKLGLIATRMADCKGKLKPHILVNEDSVADARNQAMNLR